MEPIAQTPKPNIAAVLFLTGIVLLPLFFGQWLLSLMLLMFLTQAFASGFLTNRKKEYPVAWIWYARIYCLSPLVSILGVAGAALYHGLKSGVEVGLKTGLHGSVALLVIYAILLAMAPKFPAYMLKEARWLRHDS